MTRIPPDQTAYIKCSADYGFGIAVDNTTRSPVGITIRTDQATNTVTTVENSTGDEAADDPAKIGTDQATDIVVASDVDIEQPKVAYRCRSRKLRE